MAKITTPQINVRTGGILKELADDAINLGADKPVRVGGNIVYTIDNDAITPWEVEQILSVPYTTVEDYLVIMWVQITDLSQELPEQFPNSRLDDGNGNIRQMTFSELNDRATRSISKYSDGFYYCKASAADDCRGLTLEEYNACLDAGVTLITTRYLPTIDAE